MQVSSERQNQLLRELEEEDRAAAEREAKKAKDAQKKKDKKKLAKQAKAQDAQQREEDKAAAEAAAKAEAERREEEEKRRLEEQRAKREAERKAKELEAQRKEEAKKARLAEEARKKKEKDEKAREAKLLREKEEKERKIKEEAEKKIRLEQEKKDREEKQAREKEAAAKRAAEKAEKERLEKEKLAAEQAAARAQKEKEKAAAQAAAAAAAQAQAQAAAAAQAQAARHSPPVPKQTPGLQSRSVSQGKIIPGLPKPPSSAIPAVPSLPPGFTPSPNASARENGAPPLQAVTSPSAPMSSLPYGQQQQQQSMLSQQRPSQRSFSSTNQAGPPGVGGARQQQPQSAMPVFGQGIPQGYGIGMPHQQQPPQQIFGLSPTPAGRAPPPGIGLQIGSSSSSSASMGNRAFSPLQQQQMPLQQQQAPGMQSGSLSPMAMRSPFPGFGTSAPSPAPAHGGMAGSSGSRVNGFMSGAAPGMTPQQQHSQLQQPPLPIGHGIGSSESALALLLDGGRLIRSQLPGPISIGGNSPGFQHAASGLAALNMDSQVVSGSTSSNRIGGPSASSQTQLGHGQPSASSSSAGISVPSHSRRVSSGSSFQPIGRPRGTGAGNTSFSTSIGGNDGFSFSSAANELGIGDDEGLFAGSSSASLRSISPPLAVLGSGALLDDMMEEEETSSASAAAAANRSTSSSLFGNGVFAPPGSSGAPGAIGTSRNAPPAPDDIWGSTPASSSAAHDSPAKRSGAMPPPGIGGSSWGGSQGYAAPGSHYTQQAAPAPVAAVAPDRPSVIRDRARISFTQLDAATQSSSTSAANNSSLYPIGDVYRVFLALYPDSTSVDVREFLESCLVPGSSSNGNGTFNFQQRGNVLLMGFDTVKTNGEMEPIGAR